MQILLESSGRTSVHPSSNQQSTTTFSVHAQRVAADLFNKGKKCFTWEQILLMSIHLHLT